MKAFLLAAGYGTRLRPLTYTTPKCLVPINGKPLLEHWFELLIRHGISEVYVNTHYLAEKVTAFIDGYNSRGTSLKAYTIFEDVLPGSGGTVRNNSHLIAPGEDFLICYADNLTDMDLSSLTEKHKNNDSVLTMALFHADHPESCGIARLEDGIITEFKEKPEHPESNLANAGVYVASYKLFDYFPENEFVDFGHDVLPKLCGKMTGVITDCFIVDIGTPEKYRYAQEVWKEYDNN